MYVYTKIVFSMETLKVIESEGYEYSGPVDLCKGATQEEKDLQKSQAELARKQADSYDGFMANYKEMFAKQNAIIDSLDAKVMPIFQAGPGQYGYTPGEDKARRNAVSEQVGSSYKMAKQSVAEQQAAVAGGGGDAFIPKGATTAQNTAVATAAAGELAKEQQGVTTAGYELGHQNFLTASNILGSSAGMVNPTGYGSQATQAGSAAATGLTDAFTGAAEIQKQDRADSFGQIAGGMLGEAMGTFKFEKKL